MRDHAQRFPTKQDSLCMQDRLIVALDLPSRDKAQVLVEQLADTVSFYKIGYHLGFSGGLDLAQDLIASGKRVFLDMKLLDIDNTIAKGVEAIAKTGVSMLTIHAYPKAMRAAVHAASGSDLTLLGVSVLTAMDDDDLVEAGYQIKARALVAKRAQQAAEAQMGGLVCSALEAKLVRDLVGPNMAIVTPGIRSAGDAPGDQKRVMTPKDAIEAGASHLVVGRPITMSDNPVQSACDILNQMTAATSYCIIP